MKIYAKTRAKRGKKRREKGSSQSRVGSAASSWTKCGRAGWRMKMERQRLSFPWQTEWRDGWGRCSRGQVLSRAARVAIQRRSWREGLQQVFWGQFRAVMAGGGGDREWELRMVEGDDEVQSKCNAMRCAAICDWDGPRPEKLGPPARNRQQQRKSSSTHKHRGRGRTGGVGGK